MIQVNYANDHVRKLCIDDKYRKINLPKNIANGLRLLILVITASDNLSFFQKEENKKYHIEKLKGKRRFQMSIRIKPDEGYRIIFKCLNTDIKDDYVNMDSIKILEINNHKY